MLLDLCQVCSSVVYVTILHASLRCRLVHSLHMVVCNDIGSFDWLDVEPCVGFYKIICIVKYQVMVFKMVISNL